MEFVVSRVEDWKAAEVAGVPRGAPEQKPAWLDRVVDDSPGHLDSWNRSATIVGLRDSSETPSF